MDTQRIRVAVVDDHQLVREVVARLLALQEDLTVVGAAADGHEALGLVQRVLPDVVLMDVNMGDADGIAATRLLCSTWPSLRVVMLSATCDSGQVRQALEAGACGYLLKDDSVEELYEGVRSAAHGGRPMAALAEALRNV